MNAEARLEVTEAIDQIRQGIDHGNQIRSVSRELCQRAGAILLDRGRLTWNAQDIYTQNVDHNLRATSPIPFKLASGRHIMLAQRAYQDGSTMTHIGSKLVEVSHEQATRAMSDPLNLAVLMNDLTKDKRPENKTITLVKFGAVFNETSSTVQIPEVPNPSLEMLADVNTILNFVDTSTR